MVDSVHTIPLVAHDVTGTRTLWDNGGLSGGHFGPVVPDREA
jgi:hypothetical protein